MTNKITKEFLFTELSIKIATLEMKIDRLLELAMKSEQSVKYWVCDEAGSPGKWEEKNTDAFCGSLDSEDEKFLEEFK